MDASERDLRERLLEWHNLKIRLAAYSGKWPDWVEQTDVPSWEDIGRLQVESDTIIASTSARLLGRRT